MGPVGLFLDQRIELFKRGLNITNQPKLERAPITKRLDTDIELHDTRTRREKLPVGEI